MTNELTQDSMEGATAFELRQMTAQRDHWLEVAREKDAEIARLEGIVNTREEALRALTRDLQKLESDEPCAHCEAPELHEESGAPGGEAAQCICKGCPVHGIPKHMTSEKSSDDLGDQIYALLVHRGYAQHEAHLIAGGPGCISGCVQKGYPEKECPKHGALTQRTTAPQP